MEEIIAVMRAAVAGSEGNEAARGLLSPAGLRISGTVEIDPGVAGLSVVVAA
jgi:hypothetical protein